MIKDLEIVTGKRSRSLSNVNDKPVYPEVLGSRVTDAVVDNFDKILDLASDIVDIQKMKVQSDAVINQMREQRERLKEETNDYVNRVKAETDKTVSHMEIVSKMMQDYYNCGGNNKLPAEEFSKIIIQVINKLG